MGYPFSFSAFVLAVYLALLIEVLTEAVLRVLEIEVENKQAVVLAVADRLGVSEALVTY